MADTISPQEPVYTLNEAVDLKGPLVMIAGCMDMLQGYELSQTLLFKQADINALTEEAVMGLM